MARSAQAEQQLAELTLAAVALTAFVVMLAAMPETGEKSRLGSDVGMRQKLDPGQRRQPTRHGADDGLISIR